MAQKLLQNIRFSVFDVIYIISAKMTLFHSFKMVFPPVLYLLPDILLFPIALLVWRSPCQMLLSVLLAQQFLLLVFLVRNDPFRHYFRLAFLCSVLSVPISCLQSSFYKHRSSFLQILTCRFGLLAKNDYVVKLNFFLPLALLILPNSVSGDAETCNR